MYEHLEAEIVELKSALVQKTSELQHLQEKLDDKALLIQNVSHELKNPLTVVHGYTSFLLTQSPEGYDPADLRRNLTSIHKNAERLGHLLEELAEASRLSARKVQLESLEVSAKALAAEVLEDIRFEATKKEISVSLDSAGIADLTVRADPKRVHQILHNLLANALKFTPEGGSIAIRVSPLEEGFARYSVSDTGIGIPEADLPHLFERFYQAHDPRKSNKGLGLGLEISKNLVELHGGRIWAESSLGHGTTVHFTLPLGPLG